MVRDKVEEEEWKHLHVIENWHKSPKNRYQCTIVQLCQAISSQVRHVSTIGKKNLQYVLQMSAQYGELRPISG